MNIKKLLLIVGIALIVMFFLHKYLRRRKYMNYFIDLGFGDVILSKFSTDELFNMYNYLVNYSQKGIELTEAINHDLYFKLKTINDKWKTLSGIVLFSNLK